MRGLSRNASDTADGEIPASFARWRTFMGSTVKQPGRTGGGQTAKRSPEAMFGQTPEPLGRPEVARLQAAEVDDQLLHDDGGIDHPDLEGVVAGGGDPVLRAAVVRVVGDKLFPDGIAVLGLKTLRQERDNLRR